MYADISLFFDSFCGGWGSALYAYFWLFAIWSFVGARLQAEINRLEGRNDVR